MDKTALNQLSYLVGNRPGNLQNEDPRPKGVVLWRALEGANNALPATKPLDNSQRSRCLGPSRIPHGHPAVSRNRSGSLPSKVNVGRFLSSMASALTIPIGHGFLCWIEVARKSNRHIIRI